MQKLPPKGSILLWAMMLSIIVLISFVSVSIGIKKHIGLSGSFNNSLSNLSLIESSFTTQANIPLGKHGGLIYPDNQNTLLSLKKDEELEILFSGTSDVTISVGVIEGGAIKYQYHHFQPPSPTTFTLGASGVLNYSQTITGILNSTETSGVLYFKNLGGYSKILLQADQPFKLSNTAYKAITQIGNVEVITSKGDVNNFNFGSFGITY